MLRFLHITLILLMASCNPTFGAVNLVVFQSETSVQHNFRRQQHCVVPIVLNSTLTTMAQNHAVLLAANNSMRFSTTTGIGQNLYSLSSTVALGYINGSTAVESCYSGISAYNFAAPGFSSATGRFTQVIWRASTQLGVGIALTADGKKAYVVLFYFPGGNVANAFPANVPPLCTNGTTAAPGPTTTTVATTSTTQPTNFVAFQNEALAQHNYWRQKHCVVAMTLNSTLNTIAQNYANYLAANNIFNHSRVAGLGENLWYTSSSAVLGYINGSQSTNSWYSEISMYNFSVPGFSSATGHFTQVIWRASTQLGVGLAFTSDQRTAYAVANYVVPGNLLGAFPANVPALC